MEKYILSIDQGTTSSRAIIFNKQSQIIAQQQYEIKQVFPHDGWVEMDANEIWRSVSSCITAIMLKTDIDAQQIAGISITNQRETTIVWDKRTHLPIYNAIIWQSRQSSDICNELKDKGYDALFNYKTGLKIDPYFSATKLRWILDNVKGAQDLADDGHLMFGTVDTWLAYKLSNHKLHVTDYSNASRTMMFNIRDLKWDDEILSILNIPNSLLPDVYPSSYVYGKCCVYPFSNLNVNICSIAGDQSAALFGQGCYEVGSVKNTYGTGCFLLMNTGNKIIESDNLLSSVAWYIDGKPTYALEGSVFSAGSSIKWLIDEVKILSDASLSSEMAKKLDDNENVYLVPAFVGLGAPYWDDMCRGSMFGLTRSTNDNHIVRATLESIAYQSRDVIDLMLKESNLVLNSLKVDGGVTKNDFLMQFQSDLLQTEVAVPKSSEITALGSCYLAGLAVNYWNDIEDIKQTIASSKTFNPHNTEAMMDYYYDGWLLAVDCCRKFKRN